MAAPPFLESQPAPAPRGPSLRLKGVSHYFGDVQAIDGVDKKIEAGTFVALVGASGSGKSTLLKSINRLIVPTTGRIFIGDIDNQTQELHALRRSIGYVFQNIGLFPHMTVAQNIGIGARISGRGMPDTAAVSRLLQQVELPADFAGRMPDELSGGQQQRIGFARALADEPGLMLMDEPFGALDPITRELLGETYRALHDGLKLTTIMVTHDMAEALLLADRIWVMEAGKIVADASPGDLLAGNGGAVAEALVSVPRTQAERLVAARQKALHSQSKPESDPGSDPESIGQ